MIKHIVMFKLMEFETKEDKMNILTKIKKELDSLPQKIDAIKDFSTGIDISNKDASFDLVLISTFENTETLNQYSVHPEHLKVVQLIGQYKINRALVDYQY